ncbi:DNA-directed primase/polymerase protein [Neosynchiropus ocellatus]
MERWRDRLKRVEQLAEMFQQKPLSSRYRPRLWPCQPSSVWKLFPRQSLAISFAQSCKESVHVFALEKENASAGQRIFLVTSYSELWHYYRTFRQSLMHCYEVIPEGAVCKLYFDLEFHKPSNKDADGVKMVSLLIQYVCEKLKTIYGLECSAGHVLNLDSSTDEKFSRHLIFNLHGAVFKDNTHVGGFIHAILQQVLSASRGSVDTVEGSAAVNRFDSAPVIRSCAVFMSPYKPTCCSRTDDLAPSDGPNKKKQKRDDLSFLLVKNKDARDSLFVDLGVYTKNRNFRLYRSSKVGKNAAFALAEDNLFVPKAERGISAEGSLFLSSLVCNISFTGQRILTWDAEERREGKTSRPDCKKTNPSDDLLSGCVSSPHREVDDFVLTLVKKDGIQGNIRRWNYFAVEQLLVYDIGKYRWCENVGRFHKSNNIMIIVDLKEEVWYQKCHDPDCRNFRSSSYPLPQEISVGFLLSLDEEDQAYLMDDAGNIEPSQNRDAGPEETDAGWGEQQDDLDCLESLNSFEQDDGISDQLLLGCMADFDAR